LRLRCSQIEISHPIKKGISKKFGSVLGKFRYREKGLFGNIKLKLTSIFPLIRENFAIKRALAVVLLYNLYHFLLFPT